VCLRSLQCRDCRCLPYSGTWPTSCEVCPFWWSPSRPPSLRWAAYTPCIWFLVCLSLQNHKKDTHRMCMIEHVYTYFPVTKPVWITAVSFRVMFSLCTCTHTHIDTHTPTRTYTLGQLDCSHRASACPLSIINWCTCFCVKKNMEKVHSGFLTRNLTFSYNIVIWH
jgi:hypothetical protein